MARLLGRSQDGRSVKVRVYLHASQKYEVPDILDEERIHVDELIREKLSWIGYEVAVDYWINLDTGECTLDGAADT